MPTTESSLPLLRLLQLASSNLPVGGYTFSQGLEYAIDAGWLVNVEDVQSWIEHSAAATLACTDIPVIKRQMQCIEQRDWATLQHWNDTVLAMRETGELQLADLAMGEALLRLGRQMVAVLPDFCLQRRARLSYLTMYALVARDMAVSVEDACAGHAWTVLESQVMAATKLLPMGQSAAQLMLKTLAVVIANSVASGLLLADEEIGLSMPGIAIASSLHETQYSRLYRS
ncbi:MAG: urease accessory UreF family protein [Pseudomonadales bacterium]